MTAQTRATRGGEVGTNGEFYEGGKFLPSTERPKGKPAKKAIGKQNYEPCKWAVAPEGKTAAIFKLVVGSQARYIDRYSPESGIVPDEAGCAYYGDTAKGHAVADLCEMYNRGERWV